MPHAPHRLFSVGLAILMAMWSPLCCCLMSHAEASSQAPDTAVQSVQSSHPGCHGHNDTKPAEDQRTPEPCGCPQIVADQVTQTSDLLLPPDNGRELLVGPLLLLPNSLATALLLDAEHPPGQPRFDADWPRMRAAPSLFTLCTLLTI